jgi:hypothetical protein
MDGFVYLWENTKNNMKYIGSHKGNVNDNYIGSGVYFKRAYNKNPKDFNRIVLYVGEDFLEVEDKLLKIYNVDSDDNFYNLKNSAVGGWAHCNTDKIKIKRGKSLSKSKKGKVPTCALRDKNGQNNPMYGKTQSKETRENISNKMKGRVNRKKSIIELTTKMHFEKVSDAAKYYGVSTSTMSVLIRNEVINRGKCVNKIFKYV